MNTMFSKKVWRVPEDLSIKISRLNNKLAWLRQNKAKPGKIQGCLEKIRILTLRITLTDAEKVRCGLKGV